MVSRAGHMARPRAYLSLYLVAHLMHVSHRAQYVWTQATLGGGFSRADWKITKSTAWPVVGPVPATGYHTPRPGQGAAGAVPSRSEPSRQSDYPSRLLNLPQADQMPSEFKPPAPVGNCGSGPPLP